MYSFSWMSSMSFIWFSELRRIHRYVNWRFSHSKMIGNSPVSMYILTSGVNVGILRILLMAGNSLCVSFDMSSVVGIQVSHPCIRAGIKQDLQRFNSICILIFDNMLLVERNIQFCISPSTMCDYSVIWWIKDIWLVRRSPKNLYWLSILMISLPILNWFWVLFVCLLWKITTAPFVWLNFRCHLLKRKLVWFSISWSRLSQSGIKVIPSIKSRLTIIRGLYMIPYPSALIYTFRWSIKSANSGFDNGLACRILSSMLIVSVWPNFVATVVLRFWFNFYIILHSFPLIPQSHSK